MNGVGGRKGMEAGMAAVTRELHYDSNFEWQSFKMDAFGTYEYTEVRKRASA